MPRDSTIPEPIAEPHTSNPDADIESLSVPSAFDAGRRQLLAALGSIGCGVAGSVAVGGAIGAAVASVLSTPAAADRSLDVQILRTASSLERLFVTTYNAALGVAAVKSGYPLIVKFAQTTVTQHDQHRQAFEAQTSGLGGKVQDAPDPKYAALAVSTLSTAKTVLEVVKLAITLETVARDTFLSNLTQLSDLQSKRLVASVMGVEAGHLATLRALAAVLELNVPALVALPVAVSSLPASFGQAGFPDAPFPTPTMASPPAEGALK